MFFLILPLQLELIFSDLLRYDKSTSGCDSVKIQTCTVSALWKITVKKSIFYCFKVFHSTVASVFGFLTKSETYLKLDGE